MLQTTLSGRDSTYRTSDGGYLFAPEFALPHDDSVRLRIVASLFEFAHCPTFVA